MTEAHWSVPLLGAVQTAVTESDLPLPLALILGLFTLAGAVITAGLAAVSKKWRTPADNIAERKVGIEADEVLLSRFTALLAERDKRLDDITQELKEVRKLAETTASLNRVLIDWCYGAVRVIRDLGGRDAIALLADPPEGVVITDHPSYSKRGTS